MSNEIAASYDEVPYASKPFAQSHPDRLAVLARLFGMQPAPIEKCSVLELGCASGGNIIPMACTLPHSSFLGIELSPRQVADGKAAVQALGLKNAEVRHLSIMDVTKDLGTFDYIIAHGVYSWVPGEVQEKLLQVCRENLAPSGVAYISYNTYPGWRFRSVIRDMMLYHTRQFAEPQMRITQGRAMLDFMAQSVADDNPYGTILRSELAALRQQPDYFVYHEHLEAANEPVYFFEFAERLGRHGLQYLADSEFSTMPTGNFPQQIAETLARVSNELVRTEQYMDFLRNRSFRHTLVCHRDVVLNRKLMPQNIMSFHVACAAKLEAGGASAQPDQSVTFQMPNGVSYTTSNRLMKAAFLYLCEIWPQSVPFDELVRIAHARRGLVLDENPSPADTQTLAATILDCYAKSFVVLRTRKPDFVTTISDRPMASALVRFQAGGGTQVTSQLHEVAFMDVMTRHILQLLDGNHDRTAIVERLAVLVANGALDDWPAIAPLRQEKSPHPGLGQVVDLNLAELARMAFLVA